MIQIIKLPSSSAERMKAYYRGGIVIQSVPFFDSTTRGKMNEYMLELVNGWAWVYADAYHKEPATATHDERYHFTRGMRTVETYPVKNVKSITINPKNIEVMK